MSINVSEIAVTTIDGKEIELAEYRNKVLLIVNVASYCGYTSQYRGLEKLNREYRDLGLRILGFPCNDFGAQEPGTNAAIVNFCETQYGVTFDLFDKVHAKGVDKHPLYRALTEAIEPKTDVAWNFEKFLVNKKGQVVARFTSSVTPDAPELIRAIETELAR
jgi:glutathione peroxidase